MRRSRNHSMWRGRFSRCLLPKRGTRGWQEASNCHQLSPRPYNKASAKTYVAALESYSARVIGLKSSCLMLSNALFWTDPQSHVLNFLRSAQNGWVSSRFGVNLLSWLPMHMILLSSSTDVGWASTGLLLSSLCQLESRPFWSMMWNRNFSFGLLIMHLSEFRVAPTSLMWLSAARSQRSCSSWLLP